MKHYILAGLSVKVLLYTVKRKGRNLTFSLNSCADIKPFSNKTLLHDVSYIIYLTMITILFIENVERDMSY